ncbi:Ferrous iron transport permease EfeU [Klebsiella variicola]|uniref:Ferrous iron transport permease EfeU n=1 Tax=Klebsiella variicola TaxID=244366 RepID=A0A7H4MH65_KLEVA|nr:Ferrous iron transport permease EfeU [Klebsiella variicola]
MFVPFLIMLREGLEAALIVSLIASYLKRTQRGNWIGVMWIGVILAAALCLGLGIFINETTGEFPQREQELFEGIVAVIAVVILTWMVFWMRNVSRNVKQQLEQAVDKALQRGNHHGWALVMMVFFAVAREGLESVFFLLAAFQQDVGIWPPLGALLGLATAIVLASCSTGAVSALTSACSSNGPACLFCWWPLAWPRGRSAPSTRLACGTCSRIRPSI